MRTRSLLALLLALACGHPAPPAAGAPELANELLRGAAERALASLAPDAPALQPASTELPAELAPTLRALHGTGMGARVDAFESALERAARLALEASKAWLDGAVAAFAPTDAEALLRGPDDALAVAFLNARGAELRAQLMTVSPGVLERAGVPAALEGLREGAARLPLRRNVEPDLVSLVSERALRDFAQALAAQEKQLRRQRASESGGPDATSDSGLAAPH